MSCVPFWRPGLGETMSRPSFRRWFQFRLRTVLCGMAVLGCCFAWWRAREQRAIVEKARLELLEQIVADGGIVEVTDGASSSRPWSSGDAIGQVERIWLRCYRSPDRPFNSE